MRSAFTILSALGAAGLACAAILPPAEIIAREVLPEGLEKRAATSVLACRGFNFTNCTTLNLDVNKCFPLSAPLDDDISSIRVQANAGCILFKNKTCSGSSANNDFYVVGGGNAPREYSDLRTVNFNDVTSSILCTVQN